MVGLPPRSCHDFPPTSRPGVFPYEIQLPAFVIYVRLPGQAFLQVHPEIPSESASGAGRRWDAGGGQVSFLRENMTCPDFSFLTVKNNMYFL